ncbi:ABC transporter permease subunit, partial [Pantoea agglomerans]|uniref:ABC transporter permease subunit n=1 Tax=Enterobacter agglomerans TaxID=549 RepID=UPI0030CA399F
MVILIFGMLSGAFIHGWQGMHAYFNGESFPILSTDYRQLPYYTLRTTMRLSIGLVFSMLFTLVFGVLAAKFAAMRRVILPFVNFMESVPLLGFLTFTTAFFLGLYPHSVMGLEGLAIFAVFTGQAWNMMLTLYQTLCVLPVELTEATAAFRCNPWQRFWRLGFLYSFPGLLWNTM